MSDVGKLESQNNTGKMSENYKRTEGSKNDFFTGKSFIILFNIIKVQSKSRKQEVRINQRHEDDRCDSVLVTYVKQI